MKTRAVKIIDLFDWNSLVGKTYNKPYNFQQQDGCRERGLFEFYVPGDLLYEEYINESIPETLDTEEMCVDFDVWLARDPKQPIRQKDNWALELWWVRNFYPDIQVLANDLYKLNLLEKGAYAIKIDW